MDYILTKDKRIEVFKDFGNIAVLRFHFKQSRQGCWIFLPSKIVDVLGIQHGVDGDLLAIILDDADLQNNFVVLTRDNFILSKLRPLLFDIKQKTKTQLEVTKKLAETTETNENASMPLQNDI